MSTVDLLRAHAPSAPTELQKRVLALRPDRRPRRRVRPVLVLAAAATLAVAAAVVHGFTTSAPKPLPAHTASSGAAGNGGTRSLGGAVTTPTWTSDAPTQRQALKAFPAPSPGRIQHTDASIRVRVDDLGATTTRATRIATSLGGYAQSVVYRTPQSGVGASYIELRIPAQNVKRALAELAGLGVLVSQQISIEDLTAKLVTQTEQIAQLRRRIAALATALRDPALPAAQRVLLQIKLAESKRALAQRINGRKGTVTAGATSRVSLVLTTQKHAAAAPPHRGRLGRMLHSAVGFLAIEGIVLLFALIVASPLAVALGLLWLWRRRAVERLLME
jgi:hypothetical protein